MAGGPVGGETAGSIDAAQLALGSADMAALDALGGPGAIGNATIATDLANANATVLSGNPSGPFTFYQTAADAQAAGGIYSADFANTNINTGGWASIYFSNGNR